MTVEDFVRNLKIQTSDAAVKGVIKNLENPPGRKASSEMVASSEWFLGLDASDKAALQRALKDAAELAVFSFLCVLDGVSVIENDHDQGDFELFFVKNGERLRLNDPSRDELHDLYNAACCEE